MIRISPPPPPAALSDPASAILRERDQALAFFQVAANRNKTFKFAEYKNPVIVKALNARFAFKCAYCESVFGATAPVDIEHYRPKGEIVEDKKKLRPGYYWLAVDWHNLLPSCRDCNSQRKHEFPGLGVQLRGKANAFPIGNPTSRATRPGEERRERRLLLHPYLDHPAKHLEFTPEGAVRPRVSGSGRVSKKGEVSIRVYGLDRPVLAAERRKRVIDVLGAIEKVRLMTELLDGAATAPQKARAERLLQLEIAALKQKLQPTESYSGMARQFADEFLREM